LRLDSNIPPKAASGDTPRGLPERRGVTPLRVGIDARFLSTKGSGGVAQYVLGLASGLSRLENGSEEYLFLAESADEEWLRPHLSGPCHLLLSQEPTPRPVRAGLRRIRRGVQRAGRIGDRLARSVVPAPVVPRSNGTIEAAGIEVMHFAWQRGFLTDIPSIYQPHDLQHIHLPENFTPDEYQSRELTYRVLCDQASLVLAMSSWGARDLTREYGLPPEKVGVVNWGSDLGADQARTASEVAATRRKLSLPETFLLYPAQTWPHKNHAGLLEALALLKGRHGVSPALVCTGHRTELWPRLRHRIRELGLETVVYFPGFVSTKELRCLYAMARALVFPSRFEGWGMPVCDAFALDLPVACSNATALPDIVGDAGLLFDPENADEMAECILRLWEDPELRKNLIERGRHRSARLTVNRAVKLLRAHYRRLGRRALTEEDRALLATPPAA
jgi:glycosyltransferase involved in cell wall biosynthesis